jgi:excisionase family DNA binding protein
MNSSHLTTVLTIDDMAEYLKISKSTLYKLAQEGALPGQKIGRHWRFHRDAVDEWLRIKPPAAKNRQRKRAPR